MQKTLTSWLLTALIISLGFGQLLRFEFHGSNFYLHDLLVISLILLHRSSLKSSLTNFSLGLKLFLLGLALGYLRALALFPISELLIPSLYALRLLAYLALYLVLKYHKIRVSSSIFLLSGLVSLVLGLLQYLLLPDMRLFQYLGWDDHLNRLTMPHFDPTFSGAMLSMYLLMIFPKSAPYSLFSILGILLTYARSIWLSLVLTILYFSKNFKIFLLLFTILLSAIFVLPKRFGEGTNLLRTFSITSRLTSDLSYISHYKFDLLIGRGMNTLTLDKPVTSLANHVTGPNNSYLYLLLTSGIVGLIGWGMFLKELYESTLYKPMVVFFIVASLFNNVMFYPFSLLLMLLSENTRSEHNI